MRSDKSKPSRPSPSPHSPTPTNTVSSVIALSKLYSLNDPRLAQTQVKGDLVPNTATEGRIMTRSRAKQSSSSPAPWCIPEEDVAAYTGYPPTDPDTYTAVPATLKILKVLIEELLSASGAHSAADTAAAMAAAADYGGADSEDGEDGWEYADDDTLDLSLGGVRADLMGYVEGSGIRQRDDETQAYLTEFFVGAAREDVAGFQGWFEMLGEEEKGKLQELARAQ